MPWSRNGFSSRVLRPPNMAVTSCCYFTRFSFTILQSVVLKRYCIWFIKFPFRNAKSGMRHPWWCNGFIMRKFEGGTRGLVLTRLLWWALCTRRYCESIKGLWKFWKKSPVLDCLVKPPLKSRNENEHVLNKFYQNLSVTIWDFSKNVCKILIAADFLRKNLGTLFSLDMESNLKCLIYFKIIWTLSQLNYI